MDKEKNNQDNNLSTNTGNYIKIGNIKISLKPNLLCREYLAKDLTYWQWLFLFLFRSVFYILMIANMILPFYFITPKDLDSTIHGVFISFEFLLSITFFLILGSLFWNKWYYSWKKESKNLIEN